MYQEESCLSLSIVCLFHFVPFSCAVRVSFEVFSCRLFSLFELKNEEEMKGGIRMKLALAFKYLFILFFLATDSLLISNFGKRSKGARSQLLLLFFFFLLATDKTFTPQRHFTSRPSSSRNILLARMKDGGEMYYFLCFLKGFISSLPGLLGNMIEDDTSLWLDGAVRRVKFLVCVCDCVRPSTSSLTQKFLSGKSSLSF
jgi:hypothetical protein